MNVCVIPARGGSRRIPRKNIRPFFGKPIISYSIEAVRASGLFEHVAVSTEDQEIMQVALDHDAGIVGRPQEMTLDVVGTQEVTAHALEILRRSRGDLEYACCVYATAPLMTFSDLQSGYNALLAGPFDFVFCEGWYYWGSAKAFLEGRPLGGERTLRVEIPERWVDINTEDDWARAEALYVATSSLISQALHANE